FHVAHLLHALLAGLLLFQQFALAAHVAAITLGQNVLAQCLDGAPGHDLTTKGGLNRDVEHLPRDELLHLLDQNPALIVSIVAVHDQRQRIDLVAIDQDVQTGQVGRLEALEAVIQRSVATADRLQAVEEIQHHFTHWQVVTNLYLGTEELQIALHASLFDTQRDDATQMLLRHQNIGPHDGLAHVFDGGQVRQLRWAVDVERFAVLQRQLIDHGRGGSDQVQVVFALKTLLDDLHMQHAEEADAEAEAKGIGAFRLVLQRSIVEGQLLQCIAEIFEVIRADREQAGIELWLDPAEARQHFDIWSSGQGQGVAYRRPVNVLDTSDDEAHLAGLEVGGTGVLGVEHAYAVDLVRLASGFHQHLVTFLDPPVADPYQRDDAQIVVEPGVDDQRLQRCIDLASGRRNRGYQALQNIVYAHAALGAAGYGIGGIDPDDVLDFGLDLFRVGLGQIHLVQHRHDF